MCLVGGMEHGVRVGSRRNSHSKTSRSAYVVQFPMHGEEGSSGNGGWEEPVWPLDNSDDVLEKPRLNETWDAVGNEERRKKQ